MNQKNKSSLTEQTDERIKKDIVDQLFWDDRVNAAEELALTIQGVQGISNELTVVPTENIVDDVVANEILGALRRNMYIDEHRIDVTVENGRATLSGTVPSWIAYRGAHRAAQNTPGVIEISNQLTVKPE